MISSKNVDFSKKNGKISTLDKVPLPPYAVLFLPCPLFPLTIHERVLLVLNEHFWNSACGEWLQGVDRDRRVRAVGLFNLNSNWRRNSSLSRSLSFFSRRRIRNSICFYDFSCGALPMHIPTLVVKSHWGRVFFPSVCTLAAHCLEPVVGKLYCNLKSFFQ